MVNHLVNHHLTLPLTLTKVELPVNHMTDKMADDFPRLTMSLPVKS